MRVTAFGVEFDVDVSEEGIFSATLHGETYEADTLAKLKNDLAAGVRSSKGEVPFIDVSDGDRGVIRGYHQGQRKILVTWENGQKASVSTYLNVVSEDGLTEDEIAEIKALNASIKAERARLSELAEGSVQIEDFLNDHYRANVTDSYRWERDHPQEAVTS